MPSEGTYLRQSQASRIDMPAMAARNWLFAAEMLRFTKRRKTFFYHDQLRDQRGQ